MKAIIFGANGQDGHYLNLILNQNNIETICISRSNSYVTGNVQDYEFVKNQLQIYKPEFIFHFAANSSTEHFCLFENHQTISTGTLNILEAARLYSAHSRIFISGSAVQFKNSDV